LKANYLNMNKLVARVIGEAHSYPHGMPSMTGDPDDLEVDPGATEDMIAQVRERYMDKYTHGFQHPQTGQWVPPIGPREAELKWVQYEPKVRRSLLSKGANTVRLGTAISRQGRRQAISGDDHDREFFNATDPDEIENLGRDLDLVAPDKRGIRAMADEPSLRRGESLVRRADGKKFDEA
jgi:hypothetical protein